jgi:hypothetical protein
MVKSFGTFAHLLCFNSPSLQYSHVLLLRHRPLCCQLLLRHRPLMLNSAKERQAKANKRYPK